MAPTDASFVGSLAMVRRYEDDEQRWLTVWDEDRTAFRLIEARRVKPESFRSCLDDELEDCLELSRKTDYLISGFSHAHHQAPIEWPGCRQPQWVVVEFFPVDLYGKRAASIIESISDARWLTLREISLGVCSDGETFCEWQRTLIHRAEILPPQFRIANPL